MENIKILRDKTGAGMVDCKKALEEADNDIDKAVEILRKKGIAKASKRGEREANEGIVKMDVNDAHNEGYILELNSETDFVSRNEKFQALADNILEVIKASKPQSMDELMGLEFGGHAVRDNIDTFSGVIGEKIGLKRFEILSTSGTVATYSHMNGRIGVLVAIDKADADDLARDIAMQVAAANPRYLSREQVKAEEIESEKNIYREQLLKEGKPEAMLEKIMEGKLNKFYEDICLVDQEFIKDDSKKVRDVLDGVKVEGFVRYSL